MLYYRLGNNNQTDQRDEPIGEGDIAIGERGCEETIFILFIIVQNIHLQWWSRA
jgi:hypothetical protein